jgi:hypothetical protein
MRESRQKLMGSRRRTETLLLLALLGESHPSELAALLGARLFSVQSILAGLEAEGIVVSRLVGRTRRTELDPRHFAHRELKALLLRLAQAEPELQAAAESRRSRPRRQGKAQ